MKKITDYAMLENSGAILQEKTIVKQYLKELFEQARFINNKYLTLEK